MTAEIEQAFEVSMSNPTIGLLVISTGLAVERCNPSFIWSDDSRFLAVPQFSRNWFFGVGRQKLLVIDPVAQTGWLSQKLAYYIQPETFCEGEITITLSPTRKKKTITFAMSDVMNAFTPITFPNRAPVTD